MALKASGLWLGALVLSLIVPIADAGDVPWLAEVTTVPVVTKVESLGRIEPLLVDESGRVVVSLDDWKRLRNAIREKWLTFLGPMPEPRPQIKLDVMRTEQLEGVTRQLIRYEGEPGTFVEGYLLIPNKGADEAAKQPGILALHPTTNATIDDIAGVSGSELRQFGLKLAERGSVVFCPRCFLRCCI